MSFAQAPGSKPAPESLVEARVCGLEVRVSDPTDVRIAGAQVSVVRKHDSPAAQRGTTDSNGLFRDRLPTGHYGLQVDAPGFQQYVQQDMNLSCDKQVPVTVDVQLQIGLMGQVVMVDYHAGVLRRAWFHTKSVFRRFLPSI
jgi:hypothetical protein